MVPFNCASTNALVAIFLMVAFTLNTSLSIAKESCFKFTNVSFSKPVSLMIWVSITIFFTDFGKLGYWKDALLEAIFTSKAGIVISVKFPLTFPLTENCPVVFTLSISPE